MSSSPQEFLSDLVNMLSTQETENNRSVSDADNASRRQTTTAVVHVPTSEHVAQIVGKSGSKIKTLRAKTNTCIKTPIRGDEPVFTITGHTEGVLFAKQAIEHASKHFSELMASRSNLCLPGEVTVMVKVPQQYVGVVVGRGGTVIMKIKEQTNTRINTPKDDTEDTAFEVTGSQVNVIAAKEAIEDKVRQAFQLRSSSQFDPNLNLNIRPKKASKSLTSSPAANINQSNNSLISSLANDNLMLVNPNPNVNPNANASSKSSSNTCLCPLMPSTIIKNKTDQTKSLLIKSDKTNNCGLYCGNFYRQESNYDIFSADNFNNSLNELSNRFNEWSFYSVANNQQSMLFNEHLFSSK